MMAEKRKQERVERSISGDGTMAINTTRKAQEETLATAAAVEAEEAEADAVAAQLQRTNSELVVAAIEASAKEAKAKETPA